MKKYKNSECGRKDRYVFIRDLYDFCTIYSRL